MGENKEEAALKRTALWKELEEMLGRMKFIRCKEQIPIRYAVDKLTEGFRSWNYERLEPLEVPSRASMHKTLRNEKHLHRLDEHLFIIKVKHRYLCNKQRADAMDFKLWWCAKQDREMWFMEKRLKKGPRKSKKRALTDRSLKEAENTASLE
jgi:hypothetical protein